MIQGSFIAITDILLSGYDFVLIILMAEITVEHPSVMSMMPPSLFIDHLPVYFREAEEFGWDHPEDAVLILLRLRYGTNAKDDLE